MDNSSIPFEKNFSVENLKSIFKNSLKNKSGKGIDGVNCAQFENELLPIISRSSAKSIASTYRFSPYLEIVKSKGRGKQPRIISKPTIRDKLVLSALKDTLHDLYEDCIQNQLPNTFIREIKSLLLQNKSELHYLKIDIKGFYDNLNHKILLNHCLKDIKHKGALTLIRRAIINKTVPKNYKKVNSSSYQNKVGVPQGLSISNVLAGIYMKDFDKEFEGVGLKYLRYVDDILIFSTKEELESIEQKVEDALILIGLETNDKTEKGAISESFDYLGYQISSEKVSVREATIDRFIISVIAMITDFKHNYQQRVRNSKWMTASQIKDLFLLNLNEKITGAITEKKRYGWIFYFIEITDIHLLHKIDSIIANQFKRLDMFDSASPTELKSLVKSHYAAKYTTFDGYIHNYWVYDSVTKKIQFLVKFGYLSEDDTKNYSQEEIERKFEIAKMSRLVKLEEDIGNIS